MDNAYIYAAGAVALLGLIPYALFGGADFGGGIWDLFATGPRRNEQREAISKAMGPVWEANHVWLIFVVVTLFTCFPRAFSALSVALFVPFHLAVFGIMLRGAAFVFRSYAQMNAKAKGAEDEQTHPMTWGAVFGVSSLITPILLGAAFGAITAGRIRIGPQNEVQLIGIPWLSFYSIGCGLLALSSCAYLAAVYLIVETNGELREDFRRRALISGTSTAGLAIAVLALAWHEASWFFSQLIHLRSWPVLAVGLIFFALSAWGVATRRYRMSRVFAAGEITILLVGWGIAHSPYLVYPDLTLVDSAGPITTIRFLLFSLPVGILTVAPSLWWLFKVFKD